MPATQEELLARYKAALEQISALSKVTEVRGGLHEIEFDEHQIKEGGWVPIHPRMKSGLKIAADIAKKALED